MTLRFAGLLTLPLLFSVSVLTSAAADQTDAVTPPPIKMGLWESEVTVSMTSMDNMPSDAAPSSGDTRVQRSCMTPDTWKKDMQAMQAHQQNVSCTAANMRQDAHLMSFDEECTSQQGYSTSVHVEMHLDSDQSMHGTANMKMTGPAFPQGMSMRSSIKSKFLNADCGDLKPGEHRDVQP